MTGYVFLVFEEESSVQFLVSECHKEDDRYVPFKKTYTPNILYRLIIT